ncbi:MAG TPA: polymer-forming cytoskeletal protein [Candidatus Fraserbacteria bacterium]|nr:polymer-forming cytoskeletal protein [Candidatus Fraserbacteria bacterium]
MVSGGGQRVTIAGSGRVSGGTYQSVSVAGSGVIEGDVQAKTINTAGSCRFEGSVKAEEMKTAGSCRVEGDIKAGELQMTGSTRIGGRVAADVFKSAGSQRIGKKLTAGYIKLSGSCQVGSDVEADKFVSAGSFQVEGLLSADEVEIRLEGDCRAKEIGGERIEVRRKGSFGASFSAEDLKEKLKAKQAQAEEGFEKLRQRFGIDINIDFGRLAEELGKLGQSFGNLGLHLGGFGGQGRLEVETIEGDQIYLEATQAETVRGKRVIIGPDCQIEAVEYEELCEVDESATVAHQQKV